MQPELKILIGQMANFTGLTLSLRDLVPWCLVVIIATIKYLRKLGRQSSWMRWLIAALKILDMWTWGGKYVNILKYSLIVMYCCTCFPQSQQNGRPGKNAFLCIILKEFKAWKLILVLWRKLITMIVLCLPYFIKTHFLLIFCNMLQIHWLIQSFLSCFFCCIRSK